MKIVKVLAVASAGGHWQQLLRIQPAFDTSLTKTVYITTQKGREQDVSMSQCHIVTDANQWNLLKVFILTLQLIFIFIIERPKAVITTGAAPGLLALIIGKLLRAKTIWVDSIANVDEMSLGGRKARKWADLWLTQWEHLSREDGPHYYGAVI
jgi:UDP-N-acetylglucosamine:LPS N-acetylglucosamine transferase